MKNLSLCPPGKVSVNKDVIVYPCSPSKGVRYIWTDCSFSIRHRPQLRRSLSELSEHTQHTSLTSLCYWPVTWWDPVSSLLEVYLSFR